MGLVNATAYRRRRVIGPYVLYPRVFVTQKLSLLPICGPGSSAAGLQGNIKS